MAPVMMAVAARRNVFIVLTFQFGFQVWFPADACHPVTPFSHEAAIPAVPEGTGRRKIRDVL